ncbi:MAG: thiamine pyrophosphate-dependent enzyme, partial [Chloroflexota bacterium]
PPDSRFAIADVALIAASPDPERQAVVTLLLEQAAWLLANARKPLIWAGGGVLRSAAWDELRLLAETLEAPVVLTANGRGAMSDRHPLVFNIVGAIEMMREADAVLCVGSRFVDPATLPWGIAGLDIPVVQIDIDPEEVSRNYPARVNLVADARAALGALAAQLGRASLNNAWRREDLAALKERAIAKAMGIRPQADYAMAIRHALPDDGIFLAEVTQIGYWSNFAMPMYEPLTYIGTGYQGTLGYGFATSLGAKVARPDKVVVSANGDGGFGFGLNELATMAQHQIAAIAVVFNDGAYGNVKRIQTEQFDGRTIASDLRNPDYMLLAKAFGVTGRRAESPAALKLAIEESIRANEPTLIEVPMQPVPNPWRAIGYR